MLPGLQSRVLFLSEGAASEDAGAKHGQWLIANLFLLFSSNY
jgi:hypothetical protein